MGERPQAGGLARGGEFAHRLRVGAAGVVRHERLARLAVLARARSPRTRRGRGRRRRSGARSAMIASSGPITSLPSMRACSTMPSSLKMLMLATTDAQASGWPEYVRPPGKARSRNVSAIVLADDHAADRDVAAVRPLREADEVGRTPHLWNANHSPQRPKPAITSSRMSMIPCRSHSSRTPARYPSGGTRMPLVPTTVSRMIAATFCPPSTISTSARCSSARSRLLGVGRRVERAAVRVRPPELDDAGHRRLARPPTRIAGQRDRAVQSRRGSCGNG